MRNLSIALMVFAFLVLLKQLQAAINLYIGYSSLNAFGVSDKQIYNWEKPYVYLFLVFSVACIFSIFFNVKKKYIISDIISVIIIVSYFVIPLFGITWLK